MKKVKLTIRQKVGIKLKELRESSGETQDFLAEKLDITKERISRIERGLYYLSDSLLQTLCEYYKVKESYFFTFDTIVIESDKQSFINSITEKIKNCNLEDLEKINGIVDLFVPKP